MQMTPFRLEGSAHAGPQGARRLLSTAPRLRVVSRTCRASMHEAALPPGASLRDLSSPGLRPVEPPGAPIDPAGPTHQLGCRRPLIENLLLADAA